MQWIVLVHVWCPTNIDGEFHFSFSFFFSLVQETPGTRVAAPNRSPRAERKSVTAATPTATAAAAGSGQSGETVLASFFQSLLQKKPGGGERFLRNSVCNLQGLGKK